MKPGKLSFSTGRAWAPVLCDWPESVSLPSRPQVHSTCEAVRVGEAAAGCWAWWWWYCCCCCSCWSGCCCAVCSLFSDCGNGCIWNLSGCSCFTIRFFRSCSTTLFYQQSGNKKEIKSIRILFHQLHGNTQQLYSSDIFSVN